MWWFILSKGFHSKLRTIVLCLAVRSSSTNGSNETMANNTTTPKYTTTDTSSTSSSQTTKSWSLDDLEAWAVFTGAGILLLLFIVNIISVIQRRNHHRAIQTYLLTLHTLIPFIRNYNDIETNEHNIEDKTLTKRQQDCKTNFTEYDEIEMVQASRSKSIDVQTNGSPKEIEKTSNRENEENNKELVKERDSVYSLQRQVLSTNL